MQFKELDELRSRVLNGDYDEDSKRYVAGLEAKLKAAAEMDRFRDIPAVVAFLRHTKEEIERCKQLLTTDETLTDLERSKLFAIMKVSRKFIYLFDVPTVRDVEASIQSDLETAKP